MDGYLEVVHSSALFDGVSSKELAAILPCLSALREAFVKNQFVLHLGDQAQAVGMVLSGSVHVIKEDFWGNRNLIAEIGPGELFAEAYACTPGAVLAVSVVAAEPSEVLFLDVGRVLTRCTSSCTFHARLIRNLLAVLAEKNLRINEKLTHMAQRTTREKLLSYLSAEALRQKTPAFEIPFNRQQLADYLSVDRSAMSNELCKMRDEGLLTFTRNHFALTEQSDLKIRGTEVATCR